MANSLGVNVERKVVLMRGVAPLRDRLFFCEEGFGCYNFTAGSTILGKWIVENKEASVNGRLIERLATEDEIKRWAPKYAEKRGG